MPQYFTIIWDSEDDLDGNAQHIAENGLTIEDVEHVVGNPEREDVSRSSELPCCFGYTEGGDFVIVVYEIFEGGMLYPVTAYEV